MSTRMLEFHFSTFIAFNRQFIARLRIRLKSTSHSARKAAERRSSNEIRDESRRRVKLEIIIITQMMMIRNEKRNLSIRNRHSRDV
jgi:hypothetical protein